MDNQLFQKIDDYISGLLAPEDEALQAVIKSLDAAKMPQHSIFPNQGKLLQLLAGLCQTKRILEIGTLGGYSTIWLARSLPDDGKLITVELNPQYAGVAQKNIKNAGLENKVEIRVGEALEVLAELDKEEAGVFDLVFMDAHKPSYIQYFDWALKHSRPGTLIVADNVIRDGQVLDKNSQDEKVQGVQKFNKMLSKNEKVFSTIITNTSGNGFDGMALALVR